MYGLQGLKGLTPTVSEGSTSISVGYLSGVAGFRIRNITATGGVWWRIDEVQAYPEVSYGGTKYDSGLAGMSTTYFSSGNRGGETPDRAFDGSGSTYWGSDTSNTTDEYLGMTWEPSSPGTLPVITDYGTAAEFAEALADYYADWLLPVLSLRFETYSNAGHNCDEIAVDLYRITTFGGFDWVEVGTLTGAKATSVFLGWENLTS